MCRSELRPRAPPRCARSHAPRCLLPRVPPVGPAAGQALWRPSPGCARRIHHLQMMICRSNSGFFCQEFPWSTDRRDARRLKLARGQFSRLGSSPAALRTFGARGADGLLARQRECVVQAGGCPSQRPGSFRRLSRHVHARAGADPRSGAEPFTRPPEATPGILGIPLMAARAGPPSPQVVPAGRLVVHVHVRLACTVPSMRRPRTLPRRRPERPRT